MTGASKTEALSRAITLVSEAMDVLDGHVASPEAAALLELALEKMREQLSESAPASKPF
jgi:hypothetical protein